MNGWLVTAGVVLGGGGAATMYGVATGPLRRRVVAQNLFTAIACPGLLLLSQAYDRPAYVDLALVLALLGPVGTLVFARLLADELAADPPSARGPTLAAAALTAVVVPVLCAAVGPSREMLKLLVVGVLLIVGNVVASRALSGGFPQEAR